MDTTIPFMKQLFLRATRNKSKIIQVFRMLYVLVIIVWVIAFFLAQDERYASALYTSGLWMGRTTLVLFCITITPGILKRFGITWNIRAVIMLIRRQFGVLTFLCAFLHFSLLRIFPIINGDFIIRYPLANFQIFGLLSLFLMSFLFLTSNDTSVRTLGKWWNSIHMLVYIIAWTIALHVAFIRISTYSYIILFFAVLETLSLIYYYLIPKKPHMPTPQPPVGNSTE